MTLSAAYTTDDFSSIRERFFALKRSANGKPLVYLDSAATSLRPYDVVNAACTFCHVKDGNPHRGLYSLSVEAGFAYEETRSKAATFVGTDSEKNVVYTKNATHALNLVSRGLEHLLKKGDEILLTEMEHHANLVPWLMTAKRTGASIRYIPINLSGQLDLSSLNELINKNTKVLSATVVSNVLGTINPISVLIEKAKVKGVITVLDAAQAVGHMPFCFGETGADFTAFSAHKCYGPTGLGFLVGRPQALDLLEPLETGGDMIEYVDYEKASWAEIPQRFEAGTPNVSAAVSFSKALDFMTDIGIKKIREHEIAITSYAMDVLSSIPHITILGPKDAEQRGGLIAFVDKTIHPHDLATILDTENIAIRAGHHCAQPLHRKLGLTASSRASFGVYTEKSDIDALKEGIVKARKVFSA